MHCNILPSYQFVEMVSPTDIPDIGQEIIGYYNVIHSYGRYNKHPTYNICHVKTNLDHRGGSDVFLNPKSFNRNWLIQVESVVRDHFIKSWGNNTSSSSKGLLNALFKIPLLSKKYFTYRIMSTLYHKYRPRTYR